MRRLLIMSLSFLLAGCSRPQAMDDWLRQLKDSDVGKRRQAIRELGAGMTGPEQIMPALAEALHDENGYVRHDAAVTLGKLGPAAKAIVPALVAALRDKERSVRKAAGQALRRIDPKGAFGGVMKR